MKKMEKNKRIIIGCLGLLVASALLYTPVLAQNNQENNSSFQDVMNSIRQRIEEMRARIEELREQLRERIQEIRQLNDEIKEEVKETREEIKEELRLMRQLWIGMRGEDISLLQEFLATDPEIYPEGLVTGYFGPLTYRAVKRFQERMCVEQVGWVGPKTLAKINELLSEGAGYSGKVPPGLLIAPGIRKKLCFTPEPLPDRKLPPVISEVMATSTTASSTKITWLTNKLSNSKVLYNTLTPLDFSATSTLQVSSSDFVISHELNLSNLSASTTYYYIVGSSNIFGNEATSSEQFFTTLSE